MLKIDKDKLLTIIDEAEIIGAEKIVVGLGLNNSNKPIVQIEMRNIIGTDIVEVNAFKTLLNNLDKSLNEYYEFFENMLVDRVVFEKKKEHTYLVIRLVDHIHDTRCDYRNELLEIVLKMMSKDEKNAGKSGLSIISYGFE